MAALRHSLRAFAAGCTKHLGLARVAAAQPQDVRTATFVAQRPGCVASTASIAALLCAASFYTQSSQLSFTAGRASGKSPRTSSDDDLERFLEAQLPIYEFALSEIKEGKKRNHWMWFVFPQIRGLGRSKKANYFGLASVDEARAYLAHPVLGVHLRECIAVLLSVDDRSASQIFGFPDDLKLKSSLTLFEAVEAETAFTACLEKYFGGERDEATLSLLRKSGDANGR